MTQNMSEHQEKRLQFVQQVYDTNLKSTITSSHHNMSSVTFKGFVTSATIIEVSLIFSTC